MKLIIENLNLRFGSKQVLFNVGMEIPEKQIIALIGPSGCGKSTLLRSLNRMHDLVPGAVVEGKVWLDGINIYDRKVDPVDIRQRIGMVFQRPNPFPKSVFDNVSYGLRVNGMSNNQNIKKRVESSLKGSALWEEIHDSLHKSALDLSGGQQQRLCIARAIAIEPEVILMDEPCSALDPISTRKVEELMLELKKKYTILIVTHNMQQAQRVSDKTAFMYLGKLIEYQNTNKLFGEPQEQLTRNYLAGNFG